MGGGGFKCSCFNRIVSLWNSSPSNVRDITNYSSPISSLKCLMFEKMNARFVSGDCCSWCFNVYVVIAAHHNHIINRYGSSRLLTVAAALFWRVLINTRAFIYGRAIYIIINLYITR